MPDLSRLSREIGHWRSSTETTGKIAQPFGTKEKECQEENHEEESGLTHSTI